MVEHKYGWFAACVAISAILAFYMVGNDKPASHLSAVPVIESSEPSVSAELPKTIAPANPFQQKLDGQEQHSLARPHERVNPNATQDPFKEFLEKQSEKVHQSPFSK